MSRREYIAVSEEKSLPDGCIFYCPLTQTDVKDHVGGNDLTYNSGGTLSFDTSKGMWKFSENGNHTTGCCALWDITLDNKISLDYNQGYTIIAEIEGQCSGGRPYYLGLGNYNVNRTYKPNLQPSFCVGYTIFSGYLPLKRYAVRRNPTTHYLEGYPNGHIDTSQSSTSSTANPANWNAFGNCCLRKLCVHLFRDSGYGNLSFWMKNVYMFNRYLTDEEIAAL